MNGKELRRRNLRRPRQRYRSLASIVNRDVAPVGHLECSLFAVRVANVDRDAKPVTEAADEQ